MNNKDLLAGIDKAIKDFYSSSNPVEHLRESILYSVDAGGKRIRPLFFLRTLEAFGLNLTEEHFKVASTVELIHTSSLIHDDLPAMDNDDYRRGRLTNHKVFGDAQAILAGDALLLDPYNILARVKLPSQQIVNLVLELSLASGSFGMVAGQVLDMDGEKRELNLEDLKEIHALKTGKMLTFPFVAAGIVAGVSKEILEQLRSLGEHVGLAFQIRDDIKDVTADFSEIGKTPGKDIIHDKATYIKFYGLNGSREALAEELGQARKIIANLAKDIDLNPVNLLELIDLLEVKEEI
ncbi:polyprenyl synthetase family protein [Streptococcaceae bacterium ESL0687]|nr:polyprenyl synthetase family protein [Streptococcaceae bacterium ESL0687]